MSVVCGTCAALARSECRCEHGQEAKAQRERYRDLERVANRFYHRTGVIIDPWLLEGTDFVPPLSPLRQDSNIIPKDEALGRTPRASWVRGGVLPVGSGLGLRIPEC